MQQTYRNLHKAIHFGLLIFSLFLVSCSSAQIIFENDFENDFHGFRDVSSSNEASPTISTLHSKSGKSAARFVLNKPASANGAEMFRSELVMTDTHNFEFGKEYWLTFDYMFEDWKVPSKDTPLAANYSLAPLQVHDAPSRGADCKPPKGHLYEFPFWIGHGYLNKRQKGSPTVMDLGRWHGNGKEAYNKQIKEHKWYTILYHVKISDGSDGFVEAWIDSEQIMRYDGKTASKYVSWCNPSKMQAPYLKIGVYKGHWRHKNIKQEIDIYGGLARGHPTRRELFIDNFKLGIGTTNPFGSTLATDEFQNNINVSISPNPSSEEINIQFPEAIKVETISIYDVLGKEVFIKKIEASKTKLVLKPNLVKGIYMVKVDSNKGQVSKKIIIN